MNPGPGPSAAVAQGPPPPTGINPSSKTSTPSGAGPVGPQTAAPGAGQAPVIASPAQRLDAIDEQVWLQIGSLAESMGEFDRAMNSYESALRHNYQSISALNLIAELYRSRENFPKVTTVVGSLLLQNKSICFNMNSCSVLARIRLFFLNKKGRRGREMRWTLFHP